MVDYVFKAFELGDKYRVPAMILADGMLGQMMEPVILPEAISADTSDKPWAASGHQGKRKKNIINSLYLDPYLLEKTILERQQRYDTIIANEQRAEEVLCDDADIIVVAYGASARVSRSAVVQARAEGIKAGLLRPITLWPFPNEAIKRLSNTAKTFITVEMSMGQMVEDVRLAVNGKTPVHFTGRTGGVIPTPAEVLAKIKEVA
jgi:2-oxoglutarate ferredoxin oxidoreductase subunit alpha